MKRYKIRIKGLRDGDTPARLFDLMSFRQIPLRGDFIEIGDGELREFERLAKLPGVLSGSFTVNPGSGYILDEVTFDEGIIEVVLKERKIKPRVATAQKVPGKPVIEITFPRLPGDESGSVDVALIQTFGESHSRTVFADVPLAKDEPGKWRCRVEGAIYPKADVTIEIDVPPRFRIKADENSLYSRITAHASEPVSFFERCRHVFTLSDAIYLSEKWYYFRVAVIAAAALALVAIGWVLCLFFTTN